MQDQVQHTKMANYEYQDKKIKTEASVNGDPVQNYNIYYPNSPMSQFSDRKKEINKVVLVLPKLVKKEKLHFYNKNFKTNIQNKKSKCNSKNVHRVTNDSDGQATKIFLGLNEFEIIPSILKHEHSICN